MTDDIPGAYPKPGDRALESLGWQDGPEFLKRDLEACVGLYQADPNFSSAVYAAFEAISLIHRAAPEGAPPTVDRDPEWEINPRTMVNVPWWAVKALATGWEKYNNAPSGDSFGKVLGIEGRGQGKHRLHEKIEKQRRNRKIALEIVHRRWEAKNRGEDLSVEAAIAQVADEFRAAPGDKAIWQIWREEGSSVEEMYNQRRRTLKTS